MSRIVLKFGGTSVSDTQRIKEAARRAVFEHSQGNQVVVVVSAMAGVTNEGEWHVGGGGAAGKKGGGGAVSALPGQIKAKRGPKTDAKKEPHQQRRWEGQPVGRAGPS